MNAVPLKWNPLLHGLMKPMAMSLVTANLVFGIWGMRHALAGAALVIWISSAASLWGMIGLVRWAGGDWIVDPVGMLRATLAGGVGLLPLVVWCHGRRRGLRVVPMRWWGDVLAVGFALALGLAVLDRTLWGLPATLMGAVGLVRYFAVRVPSAWSVAMESRGGPVIVVDEVPWTRPRWRWSLDARILLAVVRGTPRGLLTAISILPLTALFGVFLSGAANQLLPGTELRLFFAPVTAYIPLAGTAFPVAGVRAVDSLPLNRTRQLTLLLVPAVTFFLLGYAGGVVWSTVASSDHEPFVFADEEDRYGLLVPVFGVGDVPTDGGHVLWKPFTTPRGASREYVGWQLARAAEAFYGESYDHVELAERYFVVNPGGQVALRGEELTFLADHPGLRPRGEGPMLPLVTAVLAPLWLLPLAGFLSVCRVRYTMIRRRMVIWSQMGVLMLMHVVLFVAPAFRLMRPDRVEVAIASWLRQFTETLPGGAPMLWAPALAILAACLWLVDRRFRAMEADHAQVTVCLLASSQEGSS